MKKAILSIFLFTMIATSCDDGFEELNKNPLSPTDVNFGALFNSNVESLRLGWNRQLFLHNEVLYDVTEQAAVTAKTFGNVSGGAEDVWSNYYTALKNARELYRRFDQLEDPTIANTVRAQLQILMAYKTFQVTDLFGDIPYSEAGQAFSDESIIQPKYGSQEDIYKSVITDLTDAVAALQSNDGSLRYGAFDTFLGDNTDLWTRFANSLLLRHLVRMHDAAPDFAAPRILAIIQGGSNLVVKGQDIEMRPVAQGWLNLGVNWSFREHNKVRLGTTMWNTLADGNEIIDPRANIFFETNNADEWAPFPQVPSADTPQSGGEPYQNNKRDVSYVDKGADNIYSPVNFYLIRDEEDIPEILMTSAEVKFLLAEIYQRGLGVTADPFLAASNYQNGMLESLEYWQEIMLNSKIWVNQPEINSIAQFFGVVQHPKYDINQATSEEAKLKLIYTQRWIDSFRQPWEAFALLRRTNNVPREKEANQFFRFQYPPSEQAFNSENYTEQVSKMGGDENGIGVWWME